MKRDQLTLNKFGDVLTDERDALAMRVSADRPNLTEKFVRPRNDILWEDVRS
jgi:hypothetical protein